ncbi:phage tail protein [Candidatus Poribacteria bacterium]|nr:phage tail protein [Candidatus Poribacteria bacterium]
MNIFDILTDEDQEEARTRRINGVAVGIVTNNKDPDGMGRVKLKFPWLSDSNESYWARIATLMAGKDRGSFFLPEVDDEVLVAFEHGDINHPYVVGALWNGVDTPHETNSDGKNNIRQIRSRSGHQITFDDTASKEKVEILTNAGHKIVLDDASGQEKLEIIDKTGSNFIKIDSVQNSISIESAMKLSIKAPMIEIESSGMMTIKASATMTIKGALVQIN